MAAVAAASAGVVGALVAFCDKVPAFVNRLRERQDLTSDNLTKLNLLQRHVADVRRLTPTLESVVAHDPIMATVLNTHLTTMEEDLEALEKWQSRIASARVSDRVNRMKQILDRCEQNVNKCLEFISERVAPVSRELQQQSMHHDFVPHCNVPPNPPRLTLDYRSTSTCEGRLKAAVLQEGNSRIVGVVAVGMGGVGKTCALRGLAEVQDIKQKFTGGVLYIQLGNHATLSQVITGIATLVQRTGSASLAERLKGSKELQEAVDAASTWFKDQTCLLLIDDIWLVNGISTGVPRVLATLLSGNSRLVYTTRSQKLTDACDEEIEFTALEPYSDKAREMLMVHAKFDWRVSLAQRNEQAVRGLLRICNGLPVALGVVGETVRRESRQWKDDVARSWEHVYHRIHSKEQSIADGDAEAYGSVRIVVDSSLDVLQSDADGISFGKMFRALCVVEKQQMVPIHMLRNLWGFSDLETTDEVVKAFDEVNLVRRFMLNSQVLVQLHDVILDIALRKASEKYEVKICWRSMVDNYIVHEKRVREEAQKAEVKAPSEEVVEALSREGSGLKRWYRKMCCYNVSRSIDESSEQQAEEVEPGVEIENGKWKWWNMQDDEYIHDNVCRALRGGRYEKQLLWLLLQPEWIVCRLVNNGISALERDLSVGKLVAEVHEGGNDELVRHMEMVRRAARMGCTFVLENNTVREAWFQIYGRLLSFSTVCETTKQFLAEMEAHAPKPWAKASVGFLQKASTTSLDIVRVNGYVYSAQMDEERLSCCWVRGTTVGVTQYNFASGFSETQRQECDESMMDMDTYLLQNCVELSSNLKMVVIGLADGAIWIWNTETGQTTLSRSCHDDEVQCVAVSDDGRLIASGSRDRTVRVWEASSGSPEGNALVGHTGTIDCVAWSSDGRRVASGSRDGTIRVWNVESGEVVGQALVGHTDFVKCVAWSVDGKRIVSGSDDRSVRVWDVEGGQQVGAALVGHGDWVLCASWSADGTRVVSGSKDDSVRVWDVSSGQILGQPLVGHTNDVYCVRWNGNGRQIVSGSSDGSARVWAPGDSGESVELVQCGHTAPVTSVTLNRNETRVLSGSADCTVRMWDVRSGAAVGDAFVGHTAAVFCVAWSPDERRFVSGGADESVRVWDADSGRAVGEPLVGHTNWVRCVAWSADGKRVASGGDDNSVRLWDVESGQAVGAPLIGHERRVRSVAWSADGMQVVSGSADHTVRVWTVHGEQRLTHTMSAHDSDVSCVAWSYDGKWIVSGSTDRTVRVWNMANGEEVARPLQHDAAVVEVGLNEDGSYVVSREGFGSNVVSREGFTGKGRIWSVGDDGACVATSDDEAWGAKLRALQQQRLSTSRIAEGWSGNSSVMHRQPDGSDVRLGTSDGYVDRFGELWFSDAQFGHCRIITE